MYLTIRTDWPMNVAQETRFSIIRGNDGGIAD